MNRAIAEYQVGGRWLVCLGAEDDTFATLRDWLLSHITDCVAVRPRDGRVTDNAVADFRGCSVCGSSYWAKRKDSKFCGPTCRQRHSRARRADPATPPAASGAGSDASSFRSSFADFDGADVGEAPTDPREVFGTIHVEPATPRTAVASTLATRGGGSSSAPTNDNGRAR